MERPPNNMTKFEWFLLAVLAATFFAALLMRQDQKEVANARIQADKHQQVEK